MIHRFNPSLGRLEAKRTYVSIAMALLTAGGAVVGGFGLARLQNADASRRFEAAKPTGSAAMGRAYAPGQAAQSSNSHSPEEVKALRHKLEVLEQLLVRNQQENAQLRQQLKSLMAQSHRAADINKNLSLEDRRRAEAAQARAIRDQKTALSAMVIDLKQQQEALAKQAEQAEALYRSGMSSSEDTTRLKAQLQQSQMRLQVAQEQLRAAQSGRKVSAQEQAAAELRHLLAEQYAALSQAQVKLEVLKKRHEAGLASAQELSEAEVQISAIKVEIDKIQVQLSVRP